MQNGAASEQLFSSSGELISPLRNSHVILYTCMLLPLLGVNELRCHFIRMFLFKIYFIGLPQAKKMGSWGWVVGPFCVAERGSYNVHVCYSIHQVCKYYKQNTLTQTTCNNIGYTFLQALLVVLFVEQTPTDGTVIIRPSVDTRLFMLPTLAPLMRDSSTFSYFGCVTSNNCNIPFVFVQVRFFFTCTFP